MLDGREAPLLVQIAAGIGFSVACAAGCLFFMAACLRFGGERSRLLDSLSSNAYNMYLLHYVFVVWLQYAVLGIALFAIGKASIVFGGTLLMSWGLAVAFGKLSPTALTAQLRRWVGSGFDGPATAKIVKQDDWTR
jgi:hypothetical protein